jgi:hypothetical protein
MVLAPREPSDLLLSLPMAVMAVMAVFLSGAKSLWLFDPLVGRLVAD